MPEYKKQHYVPKFYLKQFSQDKQYICNYLIKSKKSFENKIKNLGHSDYFYGKNYGSLELEKKLGQIEQEDSKILGVLIDKQNLNFLTKKDYHYLLSFVMLQYTRTKDAKTTANKFIDLFVDKYIKPMMKSEFKDYTEEYIDSLKITSPDFFKYPMLIALTEGILGICDLKPILIINKSNRKFITSDAPIAINNNIKINNLSLTGFQSPGLQIFCPLNKDILLLLIDSNLYNIKMDADSIIYLNMDSNADSINKLQFFNCLDNVFFSEKEDESYVRNLHLEVEKLINEKECKLDILNKKYRKDGTYSEIHSIHMENINYGLKFSFIKLNHDNNRRLKGSFKRSKRTSEVVLPIRNRKIVDEINLLHEKSEKFKSKYEI